MEDVVYFARYDPCDCACNWDSLIQRAEKMRQPTSFKEIETLLITLGKLHIFGRYKGETFNYLANDPEDEIVDIEWFLKDRVTSTLDDPAGSSWKTIIAEKMKPEELAKEIEEADKRVETSLAWKRHAVVVLRRRFTGDEDISDPDYCFIIPAREGMTAHDIIVEVLNTPQLLSLSLNQVAENLKTATAPVRIIGRNAGKDFDFTITDTRAEANNVRLYLNRRLRDPESLLWIQAFESVQSSL